MADDQPSLTVACAPATRPASVPGSVIRTCSRCSCDVWAAPSTVEQLDRYGERAVVLCVRCYPIAMADVEVNLVSSAAQRAEWDAKIPGWREKAAALGLVFDDITPRGDA